jgi:hypothetical protein
MRRETAIRPNAESTPEFSKNGCSGVARSPVADERHGRSCPRRSSSPRNCARPDSRPCGCSGAIAGKHSARARREMPRKRKPQRTRVCDLSNARMCSLRCDLLTALPRAQEISDVLGSARGSRARFRIRAGTNFARVAGLNCHSRNSPMVTRHCSASRCPPYVKTKNRSMDWLPQLRPIFQRGRFHALRAQLQLRS